MVKMSVSFFILNNHITRNFWKRAFWIRFYSWKITSLKLNSFLARRVNTFYTYYRSWVFWFFLKHNPMCWRIWFDCKKEVLKGIILLSFLSYNQNWPTKNKVEQVFLVDQALNIGHFFAGITLLMQFPLLTLSHNYNSYQACLLIVLVLFDLSWSGWHSLLEIRFLGKYVTLNLMSY